MISTIGMALILVGVAAADSDNVWIPLALTAAGFLLLKLGGTNEVS